MEKQKKRKPMLKTVPEQRQELERLAKVAIYKNEGIKDKYSFLKGFLGKIGIFEKSIREEQQTTIQV